MLRNLYLRKSRSYRKEKKFEIFFNNFKFESFDDEKEYILLSNQIYIKQNKINSKINFVESYEYFEKILSCSTYANFDNDFDELKEQLKKSTLIIHNPSYLIKLLKNNNLVFKVREKFYNLLRSSNNIIIITNTFFFDEFVDLSFLLNLNGDIKLHNLPHLPFSNSIFIKKYCKISMIKNLWFNYIAPILKLPIIKLTGSFITSGEIKYQFLKIKELLSKKKEYLKKQKESINLTDRNMISTIFRMIGFSLIVAATGAEIAIKMLYSFTVVVLLWLVTKTNINYLVTIDEKKIELLCTNYINNIKDSYLPKKKTLRKKISEILYRRDKGDNKREYRVVYVPYTNEQIMKFLDLVVGNESHPDSEKIFFNEKILNKRYYLEGCKIGNIINSQKKQGGREIYNSTFNFQDLWRLCKKENKKKNIGGTLPTNKFKAIFQNMVTVIGQNYLNEQNDDIKFVIFSRYKKDGVERAKEYFESNAVNDYITLNKDKETKVSLSIKITNNIKKNFRKKIFYINPQDNLQDNFKKKFDNVEQLHILEAIDDVSTFNLLKKIFFKKETSASTQSSTLPLTASSASTQSSPSHSPSHSPLPSPSPSPSDKIFIYVSTTSGFLSNIQGMITLSKEEESKTKSFFTKMSKFNQNVSPDYIVYKKWKQMYQADLKLRNTFINEEDDGGMESEDGTSLRECKLLKTFLRIPTKVSQIEAHSALLGGSLIKSQKRILK